MYLLIYYIVLAPAISFICGGYIGWLISLGSCTGAYIGMAVAAGIMYLPLRGEF